MTLRFAIDGVPLEAAPGTTVLQAARENGIEIPTLCHREGDEPHTSCFLCVVRNLKSDRLTPACATPVEAGMELANNDPAVEEARRTALELLFSDHAGNCSAPCAMTCPAKVEIPYYIAAIRRGDIAEADRIVRRRIPFPAVLGSICPAFCQSLCERRNVEDTVSIRALHRFAAEQAYTGRHDLPSPPPLPEDAKRVAIVGAGPAGLSAAYYLAGDGVACQVFDAAEQPGGLLRYGVPDARLDKRLLDRELEAIASAGFTLTTGWTLTQDASLDELISDFDAVILALGATREWTTDERTVDLDLAKRLGLDTRRKGVAADPRLLTTARDGVFAAGEFVSGAGKAVYAVAAGRRVAASVARYLSVSPGDAADVKLNFWRRQLTEAEREYKYGAHAEQPRIVDIETASKTAVPESVPAALDAAGAAHESSRCLQCQCPKEHNCKLRLFGTQYKARPYRFGGDRRELNPIKNPSGLTHEPGKCILCGLCLSISRDADPDRALSFSRRGFDTRVVTPLTMAWSDLPEETARACAAACPTGALSMADEQDTH